MTRVILSLLWALAAPAALTAQYPMGIEDDREYGRDGGRNPSAMPRQAPVISRVEMDGPLSPPDFQKLFALSDGQLREYTAVYDSFAVATDEPRAAALHRMEQLGKVVGRDTAAEAYYINHLKELGKTLRTAQSRFDDRMKKLLTKEQQKRYKDWRKREDDAAKESPMGRRGIGRTPR
jgi:hypothetical protein